MRNSSVSSRAEQWAWYSIQQYGRTNCNVLISYQLGNTSGNRRLVLGVLRKSGARNVTGQNEREKA